MNDKLRPDDVRDRITAGKRNRKITIRRFTSTVDPGTGQQINTWADLTTMFASWRRATARETLAAAEISAEVTDVFDTRWTPLMATVTAEDRLLFQGKEYNLIPPEELGKRKGVRLRGSARAE